MTIATKRGAPRPRRHALAALRATQWAHFALLPAACLDLTVPATASALAISRGAVVATCVLGFGYLLNAMSDRATDRDFVKNPLVGAPIRPTHRVALVALPLTAVAVSSLGPPIVMAATLTALTCGTIYSVGPRLKSRPVVCTLLNVGCFAPLMLVGAASAQIDAAQWALMASFSVLLLQNQLLHEAADASDDRMAGLRTTFVALGSRPTAWAALGLGCAFAAGSLWLASLRDSTWLVGMLALPFVLVFPPLLSTHGRDAERMARVRRSHRAASLPVGAILFWLAVSP